MTGSGMLRTTCQTPARSRSHRVSAFCSASSRNSEATALVPLRNGAAPTMREVLEAPLICSLTWKVHSGLPLVAFVAFRSARRRRGGNSSAPGAIPVCRRRPRRRRSATAAPWLPPGGSDVLLIESAWSGVWMQHLDFFVAESTRSNRPGRPGWRRAWSWRSGWL